MEEHLDVGPHLFQVLLARHLHHTGEYGEHPRGHTRDIRHILVHRLPGNALALHLEVREQGRLLLGYTHQIHQGVDVFNEDGTQVAHQRVLEVIVGGMTTSQNQALAIKHPRLGIVSQVDRHRVAPTGIVNFLQALVAHRDKLRLVVGGSTRLGIPFHTSWPEDIRLTLAHTVDVAFQFLIGIHRHLTDKVVIALDGRKRVVTTVFRILGRTNQVVEHCSLQCLTLLQIPFEGMLTRYKNFSNNLSQTHFFAQFGCKITLKFCNEGKNYIFLSLLRHLKSKTFVPYGPKDSEQKACAQHSSRTRYTFLQMPCKGTKNY